MNKEELFEKFGDKIHRKLESYQKVFPNYSFRSINFKEYNELNYLVTITSNNKKELAFLLQFVVEDTTVSLKLNDVESKDSWKKYVQLTNYDISFDLEREIPNSTLSLLVRTLDKFLPIIILKVEHSLKESGYIFERKSFFDFFQNFLR
jgi:hypothetical protein